ncbi:MAG TPA: HTTM domain-containing protein [Mycobacteriales bacterium]|nr:HTTM domain-containing protein [Mycobacteriales bacterium]
MKAWQRFWFAPASTTGLGLLRIAFGLVVLGWTLSLAPDVGVWFGPQGLMPYQPRQPWTLTLLGTHAPMALVLALYIVLIVASLCLTVGLGTRVASVLVWLLVLSFCRRNPTILNAGDDLVRIDAFLLMLAPAGAALSVDRWLRHRDRFWQAPSRALWPVRLIQLQVSAMYLFAVWAKVRGQAWNNGTAVSYAMQMHDIERFPAPGPFVHNLLLVNLLTYGTLAIEISLVFLVWNRRTRPWVLLAGIALHLSIEVGILVGFFSIIVIVSYLAFLPPDTADRLVTWTRSAVGQRRRGRLRVDAATPDVAVQREPSLGQVPTAQ